MGRHDLRLVQVDGLQAGTSSLNDDLMVLNRPVATNRLVELARNVFGLTDGHVLGLTLFSQPGTRH